MASLSKPDLKTSRLWEDYGWSKSGSRDLSSILTDYPDFAYFLRKSGLLYLIRGFQHSLDQSSGKVHFCMEDVQEGIRLDPYDGHPLLLVEGNWMAWEQVKTMIRYDAKTKKIVSTDNPNEEWNYYAPEGLCCRGRYNQIYPIYQLSDNDLTALAKQGEKFFQGNVPDALPKDRKRWHYMQVFTSHNCPISRLSHVGLRLIDSYGAVYSLGFETSDDIPFKEQHFVGSYDVGITSLDYDECKPFYSRRVTTIALTEEQYNSAMQKIKDYAANPMRFNRMHQNCSTYVTSVMKAAGHPINVRSTLPGLIRDLCPLSPLILKILQLVLIRCVFKLPFLLSIGVGFFLLIATKISSLVTNLIALYFGSNKGSAPNPMAEKMGIENQERMKYFDRLIERPSDLLQDEPAVIYSPAKVVKWQEEQSSTIIYPYDGSPQLTIVPPETK